MKDERDVIEELERLDRFFGGDEPGEVPLDVLRQAGIEIPDDDAALSDEAIAAKLSEIAKALFTYGMVLEQTDHLSDRELYRWLVADILREETILSTDGLSTWHVSPIGGGSEEDNEIYLRYYADDEDRARWQRDFGEALPAKEQRPYDRDRFLPPYDEGDAEVAQ